MCNGKEKAPTKAKCRDFLFLKAPMPTKWLYAAP